MLRIAYIAPYPPEPCGIAEYTKYLVSAVYELGIRDIEVLTDYTCGKDIRYDGSIKVIPCFNRGRVGYDDLVRVVRSEGPFDIIHVQHEYLIYPPSEDVITMLRNIRKYCRSLVITMHTVIHTIKGGVIKHQKELCDAADAVIVHSILQEYELWIQGVNLSKIRKIPHGTKITLMNGIDKYEALKRLGLENLKDKFIFVGIGFIRWDKGTDLLLEAFTKIHKKYPNAVLVIAGIPQGSDGVEIEKRISGSLDSADGVIHLKKYLSNEELELMLRAADVVVLSYREHPGHLGISGAFHRVIGCFRPVICTKVPRLIECTELVPEASVPPDDKEALIKKMIEVITNYSKFAEACKRLEKLARETSWSEIAKKHIELYEELLRR